MHIVFGELIPKSISIRATEKSALLIARPMIFFRYLFILPIWVLNSSVNMVLRMVGFNNRNTVDHHSEDEIRIILEQSQSGGMMSFRGLLLMENVLDMEYLKVKNAMQYKGKVKSLKLGASREEIDAVIKEYKYSRYPVVEADGERPIGYIHIKDLYFAEHKGENSYDLKKYLKNYIRVKEDDPLKQLLTHMQRTANHMAVVFGADGNWTGILTLEDALEEVVGTIEEEYPLEQPIYLTDYMNAERVLLSVEGDSVVAVVQNALKQIKKDELPLPMKLLWLVFWSERD